MTTDGTQHNKPWTAGNLIISPTKDSLSSIMVDLGNHNAMSHLASNTNGDTTNMKCVEPMYGNLQERK